MMRLIYRRFDNCTGLLRSLLFLAALCALFSCAKDKPIQGFEEIGDSDKRGSVNYQRLASLNLELTAQDTVVATGASEHILLGAVANVKSQILLKFAQISRSDSISGAAVVLRLRSNIRNAMSSAAFRASAHEVTTEWQENAITFAEFGNGFTPAVLGEAEVTDPADTVSGEGEVRIALSEAGLAALRRWRADSTTNNGMLLDSENASFIAEFYARERFFAENVPFLQVIFTDSSVIDTVAAVADAYLQREAQPVSAGPLYVDNGFLHHCVLQFDLSALPRESTINRANLVLNVDNDSSIRPDNQFELQIVQLNSEFTSLADVDFSSAPLIAAAVLLSDSDVLTVSIRDFMTGWVNQLTENHGILIMTALAGSDVARIAFHSTSTDSLLSPGIELDYAVAPTID
jgi:hypothetical protein